MAKKSLQLRRGEEEESNESEKLMSEEEEEEEEAEEAEEEEEGTQRPKNTNGKKPITEYEKQRLSRIAENKARMEALGLHKMSSSFMGSSQKLSQRKGKRKVVDEDDDYLPNNDDDEDVSDENFPGGRTSSKPSKNKVKNKDYKLKNKVPEGNNFSREDSVKQHDDELMQAIALSLGEDSVKHSTLKERKGNGRFQEDEGKRKRKKSFSSRVKMTEDELILHFFQFDEFGRGLINGRDLQRVATAHDFMWSENEIADMIHCFDNDGDGKLNLDDFRKIVVRCNMIQVPEDN